MRWVVVAVFALILVACSGDATQPAAEPEMPTSTLVSATTTTVGPQPAPSPSTSRPVPDPRPTTSTASGSPTTSAASGPPTTVVGRDGWFLVAVTGWLPDGFADGLRGVPGVAVVSEVWVGNTRVVETRAVSGEIIDATQPGFALPLELQGFDPDAHAEFVPFEVAQQLRNLETDEVLLGASSARLRRIGAGGTIVLESGTVLTVAGVVPDEWVGFAELATTSSERATLGADRPRYAVVRFDGSVAELEDAAGELAGRSVRVVEASDVPVFRHADAVAPQIAIKARFGEFSYRPAGSGRVEIDPAWVEENIVTVALPLIGAIRCHKDFAALLRGVMEELEAGGNGGIISPASETGCYKPRFIAGRRDLSRHAWGIAADINWGNDHDGPQSPVAPPLLEAMASAGITSGHAWTDPDPGHFEWIGDFPG